MTKKNSAPSDLFQEKRNLLTSAPEKRWRTDMKRAIDPSGVDSSWTDKGGYVNQHINFDHPG